MTMEIDESSYNAKNTEKIRKVLQKFLEPNFKIKNDVYLNLFLTHLVGKNGDNKIWETDKQLKEQFCQWIIEVSIRWDQKKVNPPAPILSFALNLASQLSADDQVFVKLNCQNVYESLVGVAETNLNKDPTVTLGMVSLLCSFLEHKSGLQWVMATTHWTDIINLGLKAHTMYIRKKAYQFVLKLLEKTISFNRNFASNVVKTLLKPIKDVLQSLPGDKNSRHTQIENRELFESLKPSLDMTLEVVETMLKSFNRKVLQLFLEQDTLETIRQLHLISQNEEFSFKLLQIQFVFILYSMCEKLDGIKVVSRDSISILECKRIFKLIKDEIDKNFTRCVIKICDYSHGLICCLASHLPTFVNDGTIIEFELQMIFLQLTPLFGFSMQMLTEEKLTSLLLNDVFRNKFYRRWLKISAAQCIQICYKWAEVLQTKPDLVDDVIFSLQYVVKMKKLLNKERAATIFPPCVYNLIDAVSCLKESPRNAVSPSWSLYFRTMVDTIVDLVESFDLTWKDSIETICVMDLAYDFLEYPHWTENVTIIKGLKLLNTAISKYMSPDMVLLIYNKEDSKVSQTGSLIYAKCHDSSWEIRDSALEVVYTLSLNAISKFPAYTNILLNAELPQLVVNMALKDGEYYVRATAFKCLQELIQIPEIWDELLNTDNFLDNILDVFKTETEGVVRKEAAALIYKIDKYQNLPDDTLPRLYDVMTHAAIGDLHWEVKCNALDFWFNLWEEHLGQQGMIDQTFPSHTFSKELKKIVALNEAEVRKRIIKVLNQLSHIGCLHVMKCAVQDDCDVEVSKKATSFTCCLFELFKNYKVSCENVDLSQPPSPAIIQKNLQNQQLLGPSPSTSGSVPTSVSIGSENLYSTEIEFSNSPFFDPVSPYSAPPSPSQCIVLTGPSSSQTSAFQNSPEQNRTWLTSPNHEEPVPVSDISRTQPNTYVSSNTSANENTSNLNLVNTMDTSGCEQNSLGCEQNSLGCEQSNLDTPNLNSNSFDPVRTELMLDEFLNSNDITLLQQIYNPTDQVTNNTTQMKTKTYLAPSEFLKFAYDEVETHATGKTQWLNSLDEFDSLLDDILKEYNLGEDVNSMDCY